MKLIAVFLLAFVVAAIAYLVLVQDNNVWDIVTVGIKANAQISYSIEQDIVSVIVALLNQQAIVVAPPASDPKAPIKPPNIHEIAA